MSNLNVDTLFLIFEEIQYNSSISNVRNTLYSCLLVNKTWCSVIIPILWKNPWSKKKSNNNVIISHLSNEAKENLSNKIKNGNNASTILQRPLYNYVSFCKYLDFYYLDELLYHYTSNIERSKQSFIADEIWKLFINQNSKFTHLKITSCFYDPLFLIPGAEHCFSELKVLKYYSRDDQKLLEWLSKISKSIKKFELLCEWSSEITNLIEAQTNLNSIVLHKLDDKLDRYLTEISIDDFIGEYNGYIQSIYQNCPNLRYLKLPLIDDEVSELEILLTKCKCLVELFIIGAHDYNIFLGWDELFKILVKSSPTSLFKFNFYFKYRFSKLETFKMFLDNWKGRQPMLLQTNIYDKNLLTLIKKYIDEGIVKSHNIVRGGLVNNFEWIQEYNNGYIYTI
ncbi:hypothetical protein C1646_773992 [Rhizophagus diaphanus]|nr:hypothetical protein C1646_773992 [Rhizophagus diaphanus] [Rhizophagus sp. MUCL 43196]